MNAYWSGRRRLVAIAVAATVGLLAGCQMEAAVKAEETGQQVRLDGSQEVPPVSTSAYGTGTVNIQRDHSVTVTLSVLNMTPTASHIHEAAAGSNGPVIVPFTKISENAFVAAPGAKLTDAQYDSYKAGKLYVNVHSAKNPGGEVRAQLAGK
jgi:hypothetical protein